MTLPTNVKDRISLLLFEGVHPVRLDTYRRCLAMTFLLYMAYLFGNASEWLTDKGFHVTWETQLMHAAKPWPTMPSWMLPIFGVVMFGSTLCLIVGRCRRPATWVVLACALYVQRVDSLSAFALNKLFIVGFAILALSAPIREVKLSDGRTVSLQSVWPIRVLQATLLIIYFTSGVCKAFHGDWLRDPDVLWTVVQGVFRTDITALLLRTLPKWVWSLLMYSVLTFELLAPLLLISKRLRPIGIAAGISLHIGIALVMSTAVFFSLQMITYYVLFVRAETLIKINRWYAQPQPGDRTLAKIESIVFDNSVSDRGKVERVQSLFTKQKHGDKKEQTK